MEKMDFKYDIAFSLLAQDEGLAREINDLLSDRYQTFLYSERQQEIAGADGELKFKAVFAEEARFVVVFYRNGWGSTPWTRMEEEAIRGRAYNEGYDFVKFIPLDEKQTVPQYLPKVQLWINAMRFGAKGAASIIEARLNELGAKTRIESTVDRATRLQRGIEFEREREAFKGSHIGVNAANESFKAIGDSLQAKVGEIKASGNTLSFELKRQHKLIVVLGLKKSLLIEWDYTYSNSLDGAHLEIGIWKGHPPFPGMHSFDKPRQLQSQKFTFQLLPSGVGGWVNQHDETTFDAAGLAEHALHFYMDEGNV